MNKFHLTLCIIFCITCFLPDIYAQEIPEDQIQPATVSGTQFRDKLDSRGIKLPKAAVIEFHSGTIGKCLGTVIENKGDFKLHNFQFAINECPANYALFKLVFNKINEDGTHTPLFENPLYFSLTRTKEPEEYCVYPDRNLVLEPGKYYAGIELVEIKGHNPVVIFPSYLKKSVGKISATGEFIEFPFNLGLCIFGKKL